MNQSLNKAETCMNRSLNKTETCMNQSLNKTESCIHQTFTVPMNVGNLCQFNQQKPNIGLFPHKSRPHFDTLR
jgi:hypothetical protein